MELDLAALGTRKAYAWLISAITPRPIAWVSTRSPEGRTNLAPFSFFTGVTATPPSVLFVPVNARDGTPKDTLRNVLAVGEFVVNVVDADLAEQMNATSAELPYGESEFERYGIPAAPCPGVSVPRVAASPVALGCTLHSAVPVGEGPGAGTVVIGLVRRAWVRDDVVGADGSTLDPERLDTVGRLGGAAYTRTRDRFELLRPR